jgi:uncharacterized protein YjbI with pentapeptide repeats
MQLGNYCEKVMSQLLRSASAPGRLVLTRRIAALPFLVLSLLLAGPTPSRASCTDSAGPKVEWRRCVLDGGDLAKANFPGSNLREASFAFANLAGTDLSESEAFHAKFLNANLKGARLDRAVLTEADFTRADLTGASLAQADLRRAHFFRAILRDADLSNAQMNGADLVNADLSGALWTDGKRRCAAGSIGQCN